MNLLNISELLSPPLVTLQKETNCDYRFKKHHEESTLWINNKVVAIFKREKLSIMGINLLIVKREPIKTLLEATSFIDEILHTWKKSNTK